MVEKDVQAEILLELVFSASGETDEHLIIKKSIPLYLRKLNCFQAGILKNKENYLEELMLIPIVASKSSDWGKVKSYFSNQESLSNEPCSQLLLEGSYYYAYSLNTYGVLILGRKKPFDITFTYELEPIIDHLGIILIQANDTAKRIQAQEDLVKAKEKAEESDRLKSAFLSNMSHEIRTPMNGILGFAELLKEPNLTLDERQDFIRIIEKSGERMLSTLNDIIDVSKIESGMMKVNISESNINKQIEFVYKFFKPEVESKGIKLTFKNSLISNEAIINTDIEKVYALLTNLIKNAVKFTDEGSIDFGYVLKSDSKPVELEFFVKDTGTGISQKLKEQIFERFRQGSESLDRKYEGSGLGLSICKSYVEMLNGKIWVETEERKGSTFYFTIPYSPVSEEKKVIINLDPVKSTDVHQRKLKILVAEDDEISFSFLAIALHKISKEVLCAKTGVETVIICRNNPDIDLILMDIKMPDMDGYEATQQIRQFNKSIIIVAQTAYALSGDNEHAIAVGCNNYLTKPINKDELLSLIQQYFRN